LGEFHHFKEGFFDGAYKEKRARSFGEKQKHTKNTNGATWRIKHVLNSVTKKIILLLNKPHLQPIKVAKTA